MPKFKISFCSRFILLANDESNLNTDKTILKIFVEDSNDFSPVFENEKYSVTINENSIENSIVKFVVSLDDTLF